MFNQALVVFFKTPVLGKVKTRLAASIGNEDALLVYKKMLQKVLRTAYYWEELHHGRVVFPFGYGETSSWSSFGVKRGQQQHGKDLGLKMQNAMRFALTKANRVGIIGTDNPDLRVDEISKAFEKLNKADVTFGPCYDGGYYLMACRELPPTLLWDLPWSSEQTLDRLLRRCEGYHLKYNFLDKKRDIDTLEDLKSVSFAREFL